MKNLTSSKIIGYISKNGQTSGKELTDYLETISDRGVRKQLKKLLDKNILQKIGKPPKVYYLIKTEPKEGVNTSVKLEIRRLINDRYLYITPSGEVKTGWEGFILWCRKTKLDPVKTAAEYISTLKKYDRFKKDNLIDGMYKMKKTFTDVYLTEIYYLDFYSIERFGKTKLGQMLLYAKQSQNILLIRNLIEEIRLKILKIIKTHDIDGVLFIPPTVKREIQLMKKLEARLKLPVRKLSVVKVKTEITVPQKTLSKLEDRVENAKKTIIVNDTGNYKNILLIDDAVGSGATLNETAKQIVNRKLTKGKIIGLAITGSFKGFEVISEV